MSDNAAEAADAFAAGIIYLMKGRGTKLTVPIEDVPEQMNIRFLIEDNLLHLELLPEGDPD